MNHPGTTNNNFCFWHQPILFSSVGIHVQQVCGPPVTSKVNEHNIWFPSNEEGNVDGKNGQYGANNQPKKSTFKYEQEGRFCLGGAKIESKNGEITGKRCPVFEYTGKKIVVIYAYKKEIMKVFKRVRQLTSSSPQWIKKTNTDKVWLYESIGKLKGVGHPHDSNLK